MIDHGSGLTASESDGLGAGLAIVARSAESNHGRHSDDHPAGLDGLRLAVTAQTAYA